MRRYNAMPGVLWAGIVLAGSVSGQQATGSFSVMAMNVAGLPAIFQGNDVPGDKATNHRTIGSKIVEYGIDVVTVQEDFNYHAFLYETGTLPFRTATSGGVPFGSGLNTLSKFPFNDEARVKWDECSNSSGADCLTPKGFHLTRVAVYEGVEGAAYVDVYNMHADAGTSDADLSARTSNLRQLSAYINIHSAGNAVIIAGDTNSRYSRTPDDIRIYSRENAMTDSWVELVRDGVTPTEESTCSNPSNTNWCETVDKIFYRSGATLDLGARAWTYESPRFLQPNGDILSDHNPVRASFTWSLPTTLRQSGFHGGPHGTWFSDAEALAQTSSPKLSKLSFRGENRLDSVGVTLTDGSSSLHGGNGGALAELVLQDGEAWTQATLCDAQRDGRTRVFSIEARTNFGRTLASGTRTEFCKDFEAPDEWSIVGFIGRDDSEIVRLGFVYAPLSS